MKELSVYSLFFLALLSINSFAQTDADFSESAGVLDSLTSAGVPPGRGFRIRIFKDENTPVKITLVSTNTEVNATKTEAFIFPLLVLKSKLKISYPVSGMPKVIMWDGGNGTDLEKIHIFRRLLKENGLNTEIILDPGLFTCLRVNSRIVLTISYLAKPHEDFEPEQRQITVPLVIGNEGVVKLPPIRQRLNGNVTLRGVTEQAADAFDNDLNFKLIPGGANGCITALEAGRKIEKFYSYLAATTASITPEDSTEDRLISRDRFDSAEPQFSVAIVPDEESTSLTVIHKRNNVVLPYSRRAVNDFLSDNLVRRLTGIKKKCMNVEVYSRRTASRAEKVLKMKFRAGRVYYPGFPVLQVGDIIYVK